MNSFDNWLDSLSKEEFEKLRLCKDTLTEEQKEFERQQYEEYLEDECRSGVTRQPRLF